jgi:hypothetical protein
MLSSSSQETTSEPLIRQKLEHLIKNAPQQAKARPPTPEEMDAQQKFMTQVKVLLEDVPPESGLTYKSVMKLVKERQTPPRSKQNPKPQASKQQQEIGASGVKESKAGSFPCGLPMYP